MMHEVEMNELPPGTTQHVVDEAAVGNGAGGAGGAPVIHIDGQSLEYTSPGEEEEEQDTAHLLLVMPSEADDDEAEMLAQQDPAAAVTHSPTADEPSGTVEQSPFSSSSPNDGSGPHHTLHHHRNSVRWLIAAGSSLFLILIAVIAGMVMWQIWIGVHTDGDNDDDDRQKERNGSLLIISFDGFRADYFDSFVNETPNFARVWKRGVRAQSMIPAFPSKTFPNHYTIVTGLYPESHGIVSNTMYDPVFNETFSISNTAAVTNGKWWGGEPIWVSAGKQGRKSGIYFWPGSEAEIAGYRPTYWERFRNVDPKIRVDTVIEWLTKPESDRPSLAALYFDEVDHAGHDYGPTSTQVKEAVRTVDNTLGYLLNKLDEHNLTHDLNIMLVSDHGMASTTPDQVIYLDDYIGDPPIKSLRVVEYSPVLGIIPRNLSQMQLIDIAFDALFNATDLMPIFRRAEVPERFHYRNHRRIPELIGIAEDCYTIVSSHATKVKPGGTHGYDPLLPSMHAIFVAAGPAFKSPDSSQKDGLVVPSFENIHLYELMSHILGITPAPNNGTLTAVQHFLKPKR